MANYKISYNARIDLVRIHQYGISKYGIVKADKYYDELFKCFEEIARQPYVYQAVDHINKGYRRSTCGVDNIFYRIIDDNIEIVRILGRQDVYEIL